MRKIIFSLLIGHLIFHLRGFPKPYIFLIAACKHNFPIHQLVAPIPFIHQLSSHAITHSLSYPKGPITGQPNYTYPFNSYQPIILLSQLLIAPIPTHNPTFLALYSYNIEPLSDILSSHFCSAILLPKTTSPQLYKLSLSTPHVKP